MASRNDVSNQLHLAASPRLGETKTTFLSMISSTGAVLAACSCCILPMALAGIGLSAGLSTALSQLGSLRWPMTAFSVVAVFASWFMVWRQRQSDSSCVPLTALQWLLQPRIIALLMATIFTLIATSWSLFEPNLMKAFM